MVRNSVWKFDEAPVDRFDLGCEIFSADVTRRHCFQRECALMSCGTALGRCIWLGIGTGISNLAETIVSAENANAATLGGTKPPSFLDNHSRPPP
ncbi:MAG: hypothetical protein WAU71_02280 [Pyrinomonadaceae bacterium]